jgi:hypothetical protein
VPQLAAQGFGTAIARQRQGLAPRVGVAWAPGERKQTLRAAYGLFYGATPGMIPALARTFDGSNVQVVTLRSGSEAVPTYPGQFSSVPVGARTSVAVIDPQFRNSRVHQASAGWESEKYRAGTLGVEYLFARAERLPRPVEINVTNRFPTLDRVVSFESTGQSTYHGIALHARARLLQQLFYTIAYTVSRVDETPQEPIAMIFGGLNERGVLGITGNALQTRVRGSNDQRHHLATSMMYDTALLASARHGLAKTLLANWQVGVVYMLQNGRPYTAYVNGDINGDRNALNDVAPDTTRNEYRLPVQSSLDPRVTRQFHIGGARQVSLIWEAFNLTNRPNYTGVDDTLYAASNSVLTRNPLFGRKTSQADGRIMQLAAKLTF